MSIVGQQLLSGALSGFASTICLQPCNCPVDLLKTRLQQGSGSILVKPTLSPRATFIVDVARQIIASEGLKGLWRGTGATLIRNVPGVALYMTSLTQLRAVMAGSPYFAIAPLTGSSPPTSALPKLTSSGNLLAGAVARVGVGFVLNPFSLIKARFESSMYTYESIGGALVAITRSGGPTALFRGFVASALRDAPYAGLFVVFYEGTKREIGECLSQRRCIAVAFVMHSFSGASAGVIATVATHPFDVIKTKIQVRHEDRYNGLVRTCRTIWHDRGVRGFFDGMSLRMSRKVLSSAIGWAVYEGVLLLLYGK
ncbi:mitochondrial carrier [Fistulina hepatica ATCC 64428]|uniref:Mitochondrial glycine transporter n=1 Tax=Fistulina hepatica ATCC 64428 TaxID=1128425 RepID=A0A0D7A3H7_9AGAR|nr:mitochondrial carrier [Fistulina hepatica ATCC 64428]